MMNIYKSKLSEGVKGSLFIANKHIFDIIVRESDFYDNKKFCTSLYFNSKGDFCLLSISKKYHCWVKK